MKNQQIRGRRRFLQGRRGFTLVVSIAVLVIVMTFAITTQTVAMRDLQFSARWKTRTQAYFNARSGIADAVTRLRQEPSLSELLSQPDTGLPVGDYQVMITREVAAAFGNLFAALPDDKPVYLLQSTGKVPVRRAGTYSLTLFAVVGDLPDHPRVLLWSENPFMQDEAK